MLKQPDRIVIYPQRDSKPDYLLLWIPVGKYEEVSGGNPDTLAELQDYYPAGIESEFSQDGFDEFGIILPYQLEDLRQAYLSLSEAGIFTESSFVEVKRLQDFVEVRNDPAIQDLVNKYAGQEITLDDLKKNRVFKKLLVEPKSKGDEDPGEAFQKLSGQFEPTDE